MKLPDNPTPEQIAEISARLMSSAAGRRRLSMESPDFFDTYYCGMDWADHRSRWFSIIDEHRTDAARSRDKKRLLVLAPRDHGKTELAVTEVTRGVCRNRDIRILWLCAAGNVAQKRLRRVKTLLTSQKIVQDWTTAPAEGFGPFVRDELNDKWTETMIQVDRKRASVDPTIEAIGSGGSITGGHFDEIFADDLEDSETVLSATNRAKTRDWFFGTVGPMLSPGGIMVVIGTLKHHDDLYAHLKGHPSWEVIQEPAIITWPKSFHIVMGTDRNGREVVKGVDIEGESKVLWPEKRPIDYLLKERHAITPRQFAREFQHQVQDDETAQIKREWIDKALERGRSFSLYEVPPLELDIVQGWDLALVTDQKRAEQADTDYTVGVTWARAKNGDRYFLGIYRNRGLTPGQLQGAVKAEYARVPRRPRVVVVERNNFGELHFLGLQQSTDLPLKAHITGRGKSDAWEGVPALASLFENGKVILPSKTQRDREALEPFIAELYGLGKERHDDTVMALWIAECNVRKGGFEHQIAFDDEDIKLPEEDDRLPSQPKIIQMRERKRAAWTVWESLPREVADVIELPEE